MKLLRQCRRFWPDFSPEREEKRGGKMGEKTSSVFLSQLRAMLVRNLLLKKREKRKTTAEVLLPLYSLGVLIIMKVIIPNPNFPPMTQPRGGARLFQQFEQFENITIAIAPNTTEIQRFLDRTNSLWQNKGQLNSQIVFSYFASEEELLSAYWKSPHVFPMAVIFNDENPISASLSYRIRTNPNFLSTPQTTELYSSPATCRQSQSLFSAAFFKDIGDSSCPVNQYYYSGFLAVQTLLDYTKIRLDTNDSSIEIPEIFLEIFPKGAFTGNWMVAIRVVIPLYMVMALSQFITYLLILIVGEKENKIKEGMKIMGLRDSVFWLSWFIIYGIFVLFLSIICCILLFTLRVFQHTNVLLIFLLVFLYSLSIIMCGFVLTPFFDKSKTAGILGNFIVNIMSLLYFIQVFVDDSSSVALWIVSLISSTGFALAMDKALVLDLLGEGVNFDNIWSGPGISFGGSLVMMIIDIVLYGFLAYYLDSVIPSEHGTKRKPMFCFTKGFWCGRKPTPKVNIPLTNGDSSSGTEERNKDIEPVSREMKGKEAIRIVDLYKSFHTCRKPEIKAVNGINLTIYEGQITAILGHNGAGKTTLFNILTGLTSPTNGTAYIFGYDVRDHNDMQTIRRMTGVCPQHDILFDLLTPREHLEFFAAVRGIPKALIEPEVSRTLRDIDLQDKADVSAKYLSGGQKRKLSVGIAVIGDPKIIILDEPTAGVDPYSRRHMWSFLQNRRHGKVILLTTHFMDEADILADRKAVISRGKLRCYGSSLFLKNKFGIGYHLTMVLDGSGSSGGCREMAIARLVHAHVAKAEKARRHGRELSFILPHNAVDDFAALFSAIEVEIGRKTSRLGISSYGVSMTTLEEVFLQLERDEEIDNDFNEEEEEMGEMGKKLSKNHRSSLSRSVSLNSRSPSYQSLKNDGRPISNMDSIDLSEILPECADDPQKPAKTASSNSPAMGLGLETIPVKPKTQQILLALLRIRSLRIVRDLQKLYFMILLPLGLAGFGLYLQSTQKIVVKSKSLSLDTETYLGETRLMVANNSNEDLGWFLGGIEADEVKIYDGNFSRLLILGPNMAAVNISSLSAMTVVYNDTMQHSLPVVVNVLSNALHRVYALRNPRYVSREIEISSHPLQQTSQPEEFNVGIFSSAIFIGMIFVLVPVSLSVDMVYDREIRAKNQLRVNGLSTLVYFLTYFIVLGALMAVISGLLIVLIFMFDLPSLQEPAAILAMGLLFLLYCPVSILFSTCFSYIFDKSDSAQSILPNILTFLGFIPFSLVALLDMLRIGGRVGLALHVVLALSNTMYTPYAVVYYVQRVHLMCRVNSACSRLVLADYCTPELAAIFAGSMAQLPVLFLLLVVLDVRKAGGRAKDAFGIFKTSNPPDLEDQPEPSPYEDADVQAERLKVHQLLQSPTSTPPVIIVQNLRKEYPKKGLTFNCYTKEAEQAVNKVAVRNLSLAVDSGEVFGLLGHNGAGKTTTMKIMTAEESPTQGRVQIFGRNITCNKSEAFGMLGYCPQHDALWKNITLKEHLECYAAIRGVPHSQIQPLVDSYLSGLQMTEHSNKQSRQCSGGTRRKLSLALAMIGQPKVVLLDEPSTGMDPRSKRFLWDTIVASFQGERGAVMTTHSMEEADALCSRVGIMVKGELRCVGATQHLKNLYGAGYALEIKVKGGDLTPGSTSADKSANLRQFVADLFPEASLQESFADRLVFSVPQRSVKSLAMCFRQLEKAKAELDIEEYSFSQTTLEQVFLKFAQYDEINGE